MQSFSSIMDNDNDVNNDILMNIGGVSENNLKDKLTFSDDSDININSIEHSPYTDTDSLAMKLTRFKNGFSVLSLNAQSLAAKFDSIAILISDLLSHGYEFSAICIQETWICKDKDISLFCLPNYNFEHTPARTSLHGGAAIYVNKKYSYKITDNFNTSETFDGILTEITGHNLAKPVTIMNIYKPPGNYTNQNIEMFLDEISPTLNKLSKTKSESIVVGDFNIDLLKISERAVYQQYLDMFLSSGFVPRITLPTRLSRRSGSLIDQIFQRNINIESKYDAGIVVSQISDHFPCFICLDVCQIKDQPPKKINVVSFNETAIQNFSNQLSNTNILAKLDHDLCTNPNCNYKVIHEDVCSAHNHHFPVKTVKFSKYKHKKSNWITSGIIKSIYNRDRLYRKLKSTAFNSDAYISIQTNLNTINKILKITIRLAKKQFYAKQFENFKYDMKKTWQNIKNILNKSKPKSKFPQYFTINGSSVSNPSVIANEFNKYFTSIGPELADKIPTPPGNNFRKHLMKIHCHSKFTFQQCTLESTIKVIHSLKSKSSAGLDGISSKLLKRVCSIIAPALNLVINQSLFTGIFPDILKIAKVLPLFKKGDDTVFGNYRPISLLSTFSKVFEKTVFNQVYDYFQINRLFFKSQYGFRIGHSTELAALQFADKILNDLDNHNTPVSIFLDLSKAFDTLDHNILLTKLEHYGITDIALQWFRSYLSNRYQFVQFDSVASDMYPLTTGVPQGSILGPLLFIIYMNDISTVSSEFETILYADDTTLTSAIGSITCESFSEGNTSELLSKELTNIYMWLLANRLSLNFDKTKYIVFQSPHNRKNNITLDIKIDQFTITRVNEFNFLGITINSSMTWNTHINKISTKISQVIGILNKLKHFLPCDILRTIYNSLISPHLNYGILAWGFSCNRIFKLQKKAVRIISNSKYNEHTDPLFKRLGLLKVQDIFNKQCLKLYHKICNNNAPDYFKSMFNLNSQFHSYDTRQNSSLHIPFTRTVFAEKCIRHYIPVLIHRTPLCITQKLSTHSPEGFAHYVKLNYLNNYSDDCHILNCFICQSNDTEERDTLYT